MAPLPDGTVRELVARLEDAQAAFERSYPGESGARQPVHTVYGGAHLFRSDTPRKLGELARAALQQAAPDARSFAQAIGIGDAIAEAVYARVAEKLRREPVEDYRIDFEDGYGNRADEEEDGHARAAAEAVGAAMAEGALPPFIGIRIKPLSAELGPRALRTLDLFLETLCSRSGRKPPQGFAVTVPKVTSPGQLEVLADAFDLLEARFGLARSALKLEMMIETTQSLVAPDGAAMLPRLAAAARGRCVGAHFGPYDYTASCDVTAAQQALRHPACDFARNTMKVAFAGTGIRLSDGPTARMPIGPHKAAKGGQLSPEQIRENQRTVHAAWRLHADDIRWALANGFYQGWDLHPAQLPSRYGAVYAFFLEALPAATERLRNFLGRAAQATRAGDVFDDAATGQGLLNFFLRGTNCGALNEDEALAAGVTLDELRGRSFLRILQNRRAAQR
jgi:citrate lyase beta subunit